MVDLEVVGDQLAAVAGVDTVEARPGDGRRGDAQVHLESAGLPQHAHELALGGAPHDRVVDDDQPLAGDVLAQRVELHAHRPGPHLLVGGDEAAAHVAVLDQALAEGDPAGASEALRRGDARLRDAHHHVGLDRRGGRELLAHADACLVHALAVEAAVGTGEVDELEQAQVGIDRIGAERVQRAHAVVVDDHHLAGLELTHEVGAHDVEGRSL